MSVDLDDMRELEDRLRAARPSPLRPEVMARLREACRQGGQPAMRFRRSRLAVLSWAAAAVLAVGLGLLRWHAAPDRPVVAVGKGTEGMQEAGGPPIGNVPGDEVLGARELGIWRSPEGQPYRVVQCLTMRRSGGSDGVPRQRLLMLAMNTQ